MPLTFNLSAAATTGEMIYIGYNLIDIDGDGVTEVTVGVIGADGRRTHREAGSSTHPKKFKAFTRRLFQASHHQWLIV